MLCEGGECVCVGFVYVCVCVTDLGYVYIMLCTNRILVTRNPLSPMYYCVEGNRDLWFTIKKLNT